eukprot:354584_1
MGNCHHFTDRCDIEYFFTISFIIIAFISINMILGRMMIKFYCGSVICRKYQSETFKTPNKYFQITTLSCFICAIGCIISDFIHVIQGLTIPLPLRDDHFKPCRTSANIFAFQSYIFYDLVMLGRLHYSFYTTQYKSSL